MWQLGPQTRHRPKVFLLFFAKEWTNMAEPWRTENWGEKQQQPHLFCMNIDKTNNSGIQIKMSAHFLHFHVDLCLQFSSSLKIRHNSFNRHIMQQSLPFSVTVCEYFSWMILSKAASTSSSVNRSKSSALCRDCCTKKERKKEEEIRMFHYLNLPRYSCCTVYNNRLE